MNSTIGTERRNLIEDSEHIQLLSNNLLAQHHPLANLGLIFAIHLNLVQTKVSNSLVWDKNIYSYRNFEIRDAADLFRATKYSPLYEAEFKKAGLLYLTVCCQGYYGRSESQDLLALPAALSNPLDDLNLAACFRSPLFSQNNETLNQLRWHTRNGDHAHSTISMKKA